MVKAEDIVGLKALGTPDYSRAQALAVSYLQQLFNAQENPEIAAAGAAMALGSVACVFPLGERLAKFDAVVKAAREYLEVMGIDSPNFNPGHVNPEVKQ